MQGTCYIYTPVPVSYVVGAKDMLYKPVPVLYIVGAKDMLYKPVTVLYIVGAKDMLYKPVPVLYIVDAKDMLYKPVLVVYIVVQRISCSGLHPAHSIPRQHFFFFEYGMLVVSIIQYACGAFLFLFLRKTCVLACF